MKTKLFILTAALCLASCTIKEDRLPCPCLLHLDFGIAARYSQLYYIKGWGYGDSLFGDSINLEDWPEGWSVRVPRGEIDYSAYSGLTECVMKGNSVIIPEGKAFDKIWACHRNLLLSGEEAADRVEPHKQWAEVTIQMKNLPEGELSTEITGNSIGFSLSDLTPVAGMFKMTIPYEKEGPVSFNIPRQDDNELSMVLLCNGIPIRTYELGKMIAGTGYDWNAEDLDDIYLGMDYNKLEMEIFIEPWHGGDIYNDACQVTIMPLAGEMHPVRSSYSWNDSEINELQLMVDDGNGNISIHYFPEFNDFVTLSLDTGKTYWITAVANVGERLDQERMSGLDEGGWKPEVSNPGQTGIPMAGKCCSEIISIGNQVVSILMTRLLARVDFSVDTRNLKHPEGLKIKSISIYDGSQGRYDNATQDDLSSIQDGGTIQLYTYENMMGDLLPNNRDPWAKEPSGIGTYADKCSWIEVKCAYDSGVRYSDNITYRMYLGKDNTSNFDVQRNMVYTLKLIPSEKEIYGERGSWKISSSDWEKEFTYRKRLEILNGGDIYVGDKAVFEVRLYTDTYFDGTLYSRDRTGETIINSKLLWGFGAMPDNRRVSSPYASIDNSGTITGISPGQCTVICVLSSDTSVYATRTVNVHDSTTNLGIDLNVQWGMGNYNINFNF